MKKLGLIFKGLLIILLFSTCDRDSDDNKLKTESKFVYDGKEYPLTDGYIGLSCPVATIDSSFYAIEVYLFSSETGFTGLCPGFNPTGKGKGIALSLLSKSYTGLTPGLYAEPNQSNMNDEKLNSAILYEFIDAPGPGGGSFVSKGLNGSVTVSKSGSIYTIAFNLIIASAWGGGTLTGKFIGNLQEY